MSPAELQALARLLAPLVAQEIARLAAGTTQPTEYTSHKDGPRPPGVALRVWQKQIQAVPGARQRGRYWTVTREAFLSWEASQAQPSTAPSPEPAAWTPEQARRAGGIRSTR